MGEYIDRRADQVLSAELDARLADGEDLRVGGGIVSLSDSIGALGEDLAILDDHRSEGPASFGNILPSEVNGALCEIHGKRC
jgi:hypothetical protein